ncbi:MAG: hypothetical protein WA982_03765 [Rubrobacteraceae bacterium]
MTDTIRQTANVVGALFQIVAGPLGMLIFGVSVGAVSNANSTVVVPAGYAFSIWGVIFVLSLAYAVYQALPAKRENALLRRVGWLSAGVFLLNGVWSLVFPAQLFVTSQVVILGVFLCAGTAFLLASRAGGERRPSRIERWLVVLPLGLLFGWITAAALVGFATTLAAVGTLNGGFGEVLLGVGLLLGGGLIAAGVIRAAESGPWQGILAYSLAVLWALVAVAVNQYDASLLTTAAAVIAVVPVVLSLLSTLRSRPLRKNSDRASRPRVT